MNESILRALMRLFAIVANVDEEGLSPNAVKVVRNYLELQLNQELAEKYIQVFIEFLEVHHPKRKDKLKDLKKLSLNSVKVLAICNEINEELQQSEKVIVILRLIEFISQDKITYEELEFVKTVSDVFNIPRDEFEDILSFLLKSADEIIKKDKLLIVGNVEFKKQHVKFIEESRIEGFLQFYNLLSSNLIIFKYSGVGSLKLNSFSIIPNQTYVLDQGSVIKGAKISPLYYSEIFSIFRNVEEKDKFTFLAENIHFYYKNSKVGIHPFTICEQSGRMVGILGGSGVGKSTLLNILIGNFKVSGGSIKINEYDLYEDSKQLEGIIGYVPQDDLLIEELTVFQNLYFNAKLCFKDVSKTQLMRRVVRVLKELDLYDIKNLKVGSVLNKFISGGQRKRLNIALELVREPSIMFVDEPTSGLSSADSENVMLLLKEQTYKGKLLFINIHQPFSDIFKLFDRIIVIDKGGYPIYYGNPIEAIAYFRKHNKIANSEDVVCRVCGNVNPEQILELAESKVVNEFGKLTNKRKYLPEQWFNLYNENIAPTFKCKKEITESKKGLPKNIFDKATQLTQFSIFFKRNLLQKLTNKQYLVINLIQAPLLALILSIFSKYIKGTETDPNKYIFLENENIPAFMFMAVTVALFLGLIVSAEEIIKDRRILRREKFLNLSKIAYLNSKIVYLFALSAIQTFMFVVISNAILGINGLLFEFWLILFVTSIWANLVGLIVSSALDSVVAIYITIPLVLIPQLLLSGTVLNFSKLYKPFTSEKYTPILGDIIASRWTYEALMVTQFCDNSYEKYLFEYDKKYENANFYATSYYNKVEQIANFLFTYKDDPKYSKLVSRRFTILSNEIIKMEALTGKNFKYKEKLNVNDYSDPIRDAVIEYFYFYVKQTNLEIVKIARNQKDSVIYNLTQKLGGNEKLSEFKNDNYNEKIEEMVTNKTDLDNIIEGHHELIRKYRPIYQVSEHNFGRAQFYASEKILFGKSVRTIWFNVAFLFAFTVFLYLVLISQILDVDSSFLKRKKL